MVVGVIKIYPLESQEFLPSQILTTGARRSCRVVHEAAIRNAVVQKQRNLAYEPKRPFTVLGLVPRVCLGLLIETIPPSWPTDPQSVG